MNRIKLYAFTLLLVICMVCFTGCLSYDQLLSYLRQSNNERMQEITYQAGGSHIVEDEGIAFQVALPDSWVTSGATPGVLCANTNEGTVEAFFLVHSGNKTVEQTWQLRVEIHQEYEEAVECGQGPDVQGNKTKWILVDGTFQYIIHIPYAYGDGYLLLYVDDKTGADSFAYLQELANSVVSIPH